ncbi:MAG: KEOPS complex subunit Pcc1 [Candidatus Aenigmatarchaeota archaeon]
MGKLSCQLELKYDDERTAEVVSRAIQPDNMDYLDVSIDGSTLFCDVEGKTPLQLLHTIDDLLMCVTVAEKTEEEAR